MFCVCKKICRTLTVINSITCLNRNGHQMYVIYLHRDTPVEQWIKFVELQQSLTGYCAKSFTKTDLNNLFSFGV